MKKNPLMRYSLCALVVIFGLSLAEKPADSAPANPQPLPNFTTVEKTVDNYFNRLSGYKPGDIISQRQVAPIFQLLRKAGWNVAAQKAILADVLPDSDPLVKQLRTPAGKKFARQVAKVPNGYERLYRLRLLPRGKENVDNLIIGPDGYLMIEYMATTKGGKNLGSMLSQAPGGKGFNKKTKWLFTAKMLMDRLKDEYAIATGAKTKQPPSKN